MELLGWARMQTIKSSSFANGNPVSKATNPRPRKNGDVSTYPQPTKEQIAKLACQFYIESGCQEGRDAEHWLRAEQILRQQAAMKANADGPQTGRKPEEGTEPRSSRQKP
jgi:hypothetical protein